MTALSNHRIFFVHIIVGTNERDDESSDAKRQTTVRRIVAPSRELAEVWAVHQIAPRWKPQVVEVEEFDLDGFLQGHTC